jgi:cell division protein FtsX
MDNAMGFFGGMGASFQSELAKAVVGTVGTVKKGVPAPMDLYNEAAPRVQRILKQYDDAAPGIDFATKNWWLVVVGFFVLGVAAGYTAQVIYNRAHKRA